jgi:catechol 2,3-dioxygenase-like lactoylglutathione lyase family enzyme
MISFHSWSKPGRLRPMTTTPRRTNSCVADFWQVAVANVVTDIPGKIGFWDQRNSEGFHCNKEDRPLQSGHTLFCRPVNCSTLLGVYFNASTPTAAVCPSNSPAKRNPCVLVAVLPRLCNNWRMSKGPGIRLTSFDHVTIICADLEATRRFYVDALGMTEVSRPAFSFPGLWFQLGNVQIHATQVSPETGKAGWGDRRGSVVSRGHHIAFRVEEVSEALKIVEAHGLRIASTLQQRPDGFKQIYLYDPDGHVIEIVSK